MKTPAGQKKLSDKLGEYRKTGVSKTAAGSQLVTTTVLNQMASRLRELIIEEADKAQSYHAGRNGLVVGLPDSVRRNIQSFQLTSAYDDGKDYVMNFYFTDDLYRPSVDTGNTKYVYGGIDNIIALYNNGYYTPKRTYGLWRRGGNALAISDDGRSTGNGEWITTRNRMPDNEFMQKAEERFNAEFGAKYGVRLILGDAYVVGPGGH
jgi:hypothetical protein